MPQLARLGRRGAACPRDGSDSRAGRLRIATLVHGESPEEILTMPNRSISDQTPLCALVVLAVTIVVSALALLVLLFFF
jgi:hypothetical protein